MTTKTRKPKEQPKKTRNVKKDTQEIISGNLKSFIVAVTKAAAVYYTPESDNDVVMLKRIRSAEIAIGEAKLSISKMRNSIWREEMLSELASHEETLREKWNLVVEGDDDS